MKSLVAYFDRSSRALLGGAALVVLGACEPAQAFECRRDADCTLAGVQGVCAPTSRCAYPEAACPSGYAYPEGAGESLAGVCLPPGAVDSATDGASGSSAGSDGASSGANSEAETG